MDSRWMAVQEMLHTYLDEHPIPRERVGSKTEISPCIFRVSPDLLKECEDAYSPHIVSIGPYHHYSVKKVDTELWERNIKSLAVCRAVLRILLLNRTSVNADEMDILGERMRKKLIARADEIRLCYDEHIHYADYYLGEMMVMDACFILEFFRCLFKESMGDLERLCPNFGKKFNPLVRSEIMKDLIKLENQIPLFALEEVLVMEEEEVPEEVSTRGVVRHIEDEIFYIKNEIFEIECEIFKIELEIGTTERKISPILEEEKVLAKTEEVLMEEEVVHEDVVSREAIELVVEEEEVLYEEAASRFGKLGEVGEKLQKSREMLEEVREALQEFREKFKESRKLGEVGEKLQKSREKLEGVREKLEEVREALQEFREKLKESRKLGEVGEELQKSREELEEVREALQEFGEKLKESMEKLKESMEKLKAFDITKLHKAKSKLQELLKAVFHKIYYRPFSYVSSDQLFRKNNILDINTILDIYYYCCLGNEESQEEKQEAEPHEEKQEAEPQEEKEEAEEPRQEMQEAEEPHVEKQEAEEHLEEIQEAKESLEEIQEAEEVRISLGSPMEDVKEHEVERLKVPSAVQLVNGGVKIEASVNIVQDIRFEGRTLHMPPIKLKSDSEIFIRNLIALEFCSPYFSLKRMATFAQLMNELCQTEKGAAVMKESGVIVGNLLQDSEVTRLFSSFKQSHSLVPPFSHPIQITRKNLLKYYCEKKRVVARGIWNEVRKTYCPKPWLFFGSIGAFIIVMLTAVQVFCLFYPHTYCGAK